MSKKLIILNPGQNMEVPLDQQLTIGRDVLNSLSLLDPDVSRSHAIIFEQDGETIIKDLQSRNGVYVNGEKVVERILKDADEITLGSTILLFNPTSSVELEDGLSTRGRHILKKRAGEEQAPLSGPVNVYSVERMDRVVQRLLDQSEQGQKFFTLAHALSILKIYHEINGYADTAELFKAVLKRTMIMLGGDRGVIMEADDAKGRLKIRAIISSDDEQKKIEIPQQVLKIVLQSESSVFCGNVAGDPVFSAIQTRDRQPVHSFIAAPIVAGKSYFGFIYLDTQDKSLEYDFVALRSLFMISSHLGGLLQSRPTHFTHQPTEGDH